MRILFFTNVTDQVHTNTIRLHFFKILFTCTEAVSQLCVFFWLQYCFYTFNFFLQVKYVAFFLVFFLLLPNHNFSVMGHQLTSTILSQQQKVAQYFWVTEWRKLGLIRRFCDQHHVTFLPLKDTTSLLWPVEFSGQESLCLISDMGGNPDISIRSWFSNQSCSKLLLRTFCLYKAWRRGMWCECGKRRVLTFWIKLPWKFSCNRQKRLQSDPKRTFVWATHQAHTFHYNRPRCWTMNMSEKLLLTISCLLLDHQQCNRKNIQFNSHTDRIYRSYAKQKCILI